MANPSQEFRYRITVSWRGAGNIRAELAMTVTDFAALGSIVADNAPDGWSIAYVTITQPASNWQRAWDQAAIDDERRYAPDDAKAAA